MKSWLEKNAIRRCSTHNEGKSAVAERFIRTLKNKICKYMTSISINVYIDKLDDSINKYNNTYHSTIKMRPVDVTSNTYISSSTKIIDKDPKFKIGDIVRIPKYRNIFANDYIPNWSQEVFMIKNVKNTARGYILLVTLKAKKFLESFMKNNFKKQIKKSLELKK